MSKTLALSFLPTYAPLPSFLSQGAVPISPRFPRNGTSAAFPASGITGLAGTITPERSAVEAQAWGATVALWSYTDLAASWGYASPAAFVGEFTAAGIPIQGTTNTRSVSPSTGPFMQDAGGSNWSAGSNPDRPALNSGVQNPLKSRIPVTIDYMPAADVGGTHDPKLSAIATQMAAGCFGLHMDDPRGGMAYAGWRGIAPSYDITSQGADFSPTARAGFTGWLGANTSAAERTAVGLPSNLSGFDILTWLTTNKASIMFGANQQNPSAVDNFLFRTGISNDESLRTIILRWMGRFLRDDHAAYVQKVRTQLAGAPLSLNFWQASPSEYLSWMTRTTPKLWDFAVAETAPPNWAQLSPHTVGSPNFMTARALQCAAQHVNAVTCDWVGLRAFFEHKPTALNQAPPRVVVQLLRQSIMQSVMEGHTPVIPIDVFMTTNGGDYDQGVTVDGYRFWGGRADYKDCFDFVRANRALLEGYEKMATVHVAFHTDSFPFHSGTQSSRWNAVMQRLAQLWLADVDYHILPVGAADGLLPTDPVRSVETAAPLIIRVQDDVDYYAHLGRLAGTSCRRWRSDVVTEAMRYSPVRSSNPHVRATARVNPLTGRVAVHLHNYAINADGTPLEQTTTLTYRWGTPASAQVVRLGQSGGTATFSGAGETTLTVREYAILSF